MRLSFLVVVLYAAVSIVQSRSFDTSVHDRFAGLSKTDALSAAETIRAELISGDYSEEDFESKCNAMLFGMLLASSKAGQVTASSSRSVFTVHDAVLIFSSDVQAVSTALVQLGALFYADITRAKYRYILELASSVISSLHGHRYQDVISMCQPLMEDILATLSTLYLRDQLHFDVIRTSRLLLSEWSMPSSPRYTEGLGNLASSQYRVGDFLAAAESYEELLALLKSTKDEESEDDSKEISPDGMECLGNAMSSLAATYYQLHDYDEAEQFYLAAISAYDQAKQMLLLKTEEGDGRGYSDNDAVDISLPIVSQEVKDEYVSWTLQEEWVLAQTHLALVHLAQGRWWEGADLLEDMLPYLTRMRPQTATAISREKLWLAQLVNLTVDGYRQAQLLFVDASMRTESKLAKLRADAVTLKYEAVVVTAQLQLHLEQQLEPAEASDALLLDDVALDQPGGFEKNASSQVDGVLGNVNSSVSSNGIGTQTKVEEAKTAFGALVPDEKVANGDESSSGSASNGSDSASNGSASDSNDSDSNGDSARVVGGSADDGGGRSVGKRGYAPPRTTTSRAASSGGSSTRLPTAARGSEHRGGGRDGGGATRARGGDRGASYDEVAAKLANPLTRVHSPQKEGSGSGSRSGEGGGRWAKLVFSVVMLLALLLSSWLLIAIVSLRYPHIEPSKIVNECMSRVGLVGAPFESPDKFEGSRQGNLSGAEVSEMDMDTSSCKEDSIYLSE
jgi:tetratricopeptide (TPR) repeat protein